MTKEQLQDIKARTGQLKVQAEMALAAIVMLERNVREVAQQIQALNIQLGAR